MIEFIKKQKYNFIATVITVIVVHFSKIAHYLPNWDNMYSIVMPLDSMSHFGRWFAGLITSIFTSQYDLQWVSGLISAVFLGLTMSLLLDLFDVKDKVLSLLAILIMVTFPSIAGVFMYVEWTASYMISLFMAILSIYLIFKFESRWRWCLCPLLICFSLGIYQIYFLFAITCAVFYFATQLIRENKKFKEYLDVIKLFIYSVVVGFILYFFINRIVLLCLKESLSEYQGIGAVGFLGFKGYLKAIIKTIASTILFFIPVGGGYALINIVILAIVTSLLIMVLIKGGQKLWIKIVVPLLFVSIMPITFLYYFITATISYHTIMTISLYFVYFELIVFLDSNLVSLKRIVSGFISAILFVLGFYNFINTNIAYKQQEISYERTYFEVCEVVSYIDLVNDGLSNEIIVVGNFPANNVDNLISPVPTIVGASTSNFLRSEFHFLQFTKYYLAREYKTCAGDKRDNILKSDDFESMKTYPSKDCVKIIDNVIVVKLS